GDVEDKKTEYHRYKSDLIVIKNHYSETTKIGRQLTRNLSFLYNDVDKKSRFINVLWDLQMERQAIQDQNELNNEISLERVSNAYLDIRNQDHKLREITTKQIENLVEYVTGQKRPCDGELSPNKFKTVSTEIESIHNESLSDSRQKREKIPSKIINEINEQVMINEETSNRVGLVRPSALVSNMTGPNANSISIGSVTLKTDPTLLSSNCFNSFSNDNLTYMKNEDVFHNTKNIPLTNDSSETFSQTLFSTDKKSNSETTPPRLFEAT
ncbi:21149_t:CDS:2, partial [Cetraspora pellucida]